MENEHPNARTLQELRQSVARYGVGVELPEPELAHCDDCNGYGAVYACRSGRLVCLPHWLSRQRAGQRLQQLEVSAP